MYDLTRIDLGKDEAEQDQRLREYFLKTSNYKNALVGTKTIVIGRKGSGKSAIFTLMKSEIEDLGLLVIPITPDQYSWSVLKDYQEKGILPEQAHTNAWKLTLLSSVVWKLNEINLIPRDSKLVNYYKSMKDAFVPTREDWFLNIVKKTKDFVSGIKTQWVTFDWGETGTVATPLRIVEEIKVALLKDWPQGKEVRILIDRLDDSYDASKESQNLIIGLLKAANEINASFSNKLIVTVFLRSDIYDNLFFDDQDKLRQYEETLNWKKDDLKAVICERVRASLNLGGIDNNQIWQNLFSEKSYRSQAPAEKYIIDRTFKRPRDIISFVRFAIETAIRNEHSVIETEDTRTAEEEKYSQSKYKDMIIEFQKHYPYIKDLLDSFSGSLHKLPQADLTKHLDGFIEDKKLQIQPVQLLRNLFTWGIIGVKRQGRAGVKQRGGAQFYYYYDDPSINPLAYSDYYIHPSLRYHLNISEKRERLKNADISGLEEYGLETTTENDSEVTEKPKLNLPRFTEMEINQVNHDETAEIQHHQLGKKIISSKDMELKKISEELKSMSFKFSFESNELFGFDAKSMHFYLGFLYKRDIIDYKLIDKDTIEIYLTNKGKEKFEKLNIKRTS
jgi:hypothetical protein